MAVKTLYLLGGTLQNSFEPMQDGGTAPTDAFFATGTGWISAANSNGSMAELRPNVIRARTVFAATAVPTALTTGASANAFVSPTPYTGTFAAGNWTLSASMRSSVAQPSTLRLRWRVFASADATGATGVRELTTAVQLTNAVADTITANSTRTVTWAAPAITLDNEYLFFACALEMVALSGTGNTRDNQFRKNSASVITTTDFAAPTVVSPTGFADTEAFGTESAQISAAPIGFAETEDFGAQASQINASPTGFADTEAFGTPSVGAGPTNVGPTGFADAEAFGTPSIQVGASPTGFAETEAFGTDAAQPTASPTGFADAETFGTESVRLSASPTGFADVEAFGNESIQLGAGPTGFADTEAFGAQSIRLGAGPTGFADVEAFGTPVVGTPPAGPAPSGFADVEAFGIPVIRLSTSPTGFVDAEAFGAQGIRLGAGPTGFADAEAFGVLAASDASAPAPSLMLPNDGRNASELVRALDAASGQSYRAGNRVGASESTAALVSDGRDTASVTR